MPNWSRNQVSVSFRVVPLVSTGSETSAIAGVFVILTRPLPPSLTEEPILSEMSAGAGSRAGREEPQLLMRRFAPFTTSTICHSIGRSAKAKSMTRSSSSMPMYRRPSSRAATQERPLP